jgi:hypothetical protein
MLPQQVSTFCLPGKKYLQLMLAQQQTENILILAAEQVEVLSARGRDAYRSCIQLLRTVATFAVTVVGHLRVTQWDTILYFIGEKPANATEIRYSKLLIAPHMAIYQLELAELQPVLDTLSRPNAKEIHLTTPGLGYAWIPGAERHAALRIVGSLKGQEAQLMLRQPARHSPATAYPGG